jgi:HEPN domain-containing protein
MQEHEKWLRIAREDLLAAKGLLKLELFSAVAYHCQQSAEKSLKAYLVFKKYPVIKTHDLIKLLELCMTFDLDFRNKFDAADYINPFSSKFRYPTEFDIPDFAEAQFAIKHAQSIMTFVVKKIVEPETGQTSIF